MASFFVSAFATWILAAAANRYRPPGHDIIDLAEIGLLFVAPLIGDAPGAIIVKHRFLPKNDA